MPSHEHAYAPLSTETQLLFQQPMYVIRTSAVEFQILPMFRATTKPPKPYKSPGLRITVPLCSYKPLSSFTVLAKTCTWHDIILLESEYVSISICSLTASVNYENKLKCSLDSVQEFTTQTHVLVWCLEGYWDVYSVLSKCAIITSAVLCH